MTVSEADRSLCGYMISTFWAPWKRGDCARVTRHEGARFGYNVHQMDPLLDEP